MSDPTTGEITLPEGFNPLRCKHHAERADSHSRRLRTLEDKADDLDRRMIKLGYRVGFWALTGAFVGTIGSKALGLLKWVP